MLMNNNNRFVLIDNTRRSAYVYELRKLLAVYEFTDKPLSSEDVEWIRTQEYKDKA